MSNSAPSESGTSRRGFLTIGSKLIAAAAVSPIVGACDAVRFGTLQGVGTAIAGKNAPKESYDIHDKDGVDDMLRGLVDDVWQGDFKKIFQGNPENIAKTLTKNPFGIVVENLERIISEAIKKDPRIKAQYGTPADLAKIDRVLLDIKTRLGSTSLYDLGKSTLDKPNEPNISDSLRRDLLGWNPEKIAHYHKNFKKLFDKRGNRPVHYPDDSWLAIVFFMREMLGRDVFETDITSKKAILSFETQLLVTSLVSRIRKRMEIVYERYAVEAPVTAAGVALSTIMTLPAAFGLATVPSIIDGLVKDWRPRALEEGYTSAYKAIEDIAKKDNEASQGKKVDDIRYTEYNWNAPANLARMQQLVVELNKLYALLKKTNPLNARVDQQGSLVPQIYERLQIIRAIIQKARPDTDLTRAQKTYILANIDLMVAETLFLNAGFFSTFLSKLTGAGIFKL